MIGRAFEQAPFVFGEGAVGVETVQAEQGVEMAAPVVGQIAHDTFDTVARKTAAIDRTLQESGVADHRTHVDRLTDVVEQGRQNGVDALCSFERLRVACLDAERHHTVKHVRRVVAGPPERAVEIDEIAEGAQGRLAKCIRAAVFNRVVEIGDENIDAIHSSPVLSRLSRPVVFLDGTRRVLARFINGVKPGSNHGAACRE